MTGAKRGLFLDLDGTLADSLPTLYAVYLEFLRTFGCAGTEAEFEAVNGPPLEVVVEHLGRNHRLPGKPSEWLAAYRRLLQGAHERAHPAAGAREVLLRARERGWIAVVVTSAGRELAMGWLHRVRLAPLVAAVVAGEDVTRGKPDPEPYRLALTRSGCDAAASITIEDSAQGATAAIAAGLPTWLLRGAAGDRVSQSPLFRGAIADFRAVAGLL